MTTDTCLFSFNSLSETVEKTLWNDKEGIKRKHEKKLHA